MAFEDYWDFTTKQWIRGPVQRDRVARETNRIDIRDWKDPQAILDEAERNRKANQHATYDGYDEAVAKALYRSENGYDHWQRELEDDIREADRANEPKRKPL